MIRPQRWILIRGLIRSRLHWGDFPQTLKSQLKLTSVECVELPGNGILHTEKTPARIEDAISAMKSQIEPIEQPVHLLGISLGGILATKWAQLYPNEVSHLSLINSSSGLSPFYDRLYPANYVSIIKNLLAGTPRELEEFILKVSSNEKEKWKPVLDRYTAFHAEHPVSTANFIRQLQLTSQVNFKDIPHSSNKIYASARDRLVNPDCSRQIAKKWNCELFLNSKAGHDLPLDDENWLISQLQNT